MSVETLRAEIDALDEQLVRLLNERAGLAKAIGQEKRKRHAPVHDAVREDQVLARVTSLSRGPLSQGAVEDVYRAVMAGCLAAQEADSRGQGS